MLRQALQTLIGNINGVFERRMCCIDAWTAARTGHLQCLKNFREHILVWSTHDKEILLFLLIRTNCSSQDKPSESYVDCVKYLVEELGTHFDHPRILLEPNYSSDMKLFEYILEHFDFTFINRSIQQLYMTGVWNGWLEASPLQKGRMLCRMHKLGLLTPENMNKCQHVVFLEELRYLVEEVGADLSYLKTLRFSDETHPKDIDWALQYFHLDQLSPDEVSPAIWTRLYSAALKNNRLLIKYSNIRKLVLRRTHSDRGQCCSNTLVNGCPFAQCIMRWKMWEQGVTDQLVEVAGLPEDVIKFVLLPYV